jgi:hypothetical protein
VEGRVRSDSAGFPLLAAWLIGSGIVRMIGVSVKPTIGYLLFTTGWSGVYLVAAIVNNHI